MKLKTKVFEAKQFTATEWSSPEDKAEFANHLIQFIEQGYPATLFNKKFYVRLSMTFGHIAHYNQGGFWSVWFKNDSGKQDFIHNIMNCECYDSPAFTYSDVERAVKSYLRDCRGVSKFEQIDLI
jgi:hypothetical protein